MVAKTLAPLPYEYAFVVQFGRDTDTGRSNFVGQVEHLDSGRQGRFSSSQELFAWIGDMLAGTDTGSS